jgi:periplasmic protein CpxP/Spy
MKKMILSVFALVTIASISFAQEGKLQHQKDANERAEMQTKKMTEKLSLTADQAAKIKEINLETARKMDALRSQSLSDREAIKTQKTAIQKEKSEKISSVLTAKQKEEYKKMIAEAKQNQDHDHPHHRDQHNKE